MITISNDFKEALKNIKKLDVIISYIDKEHTNYIITQNSELLQTEAQDFIITESDNVVIDNGGIQKCAIYWNTDLLKSACKMLDLETSSPIEKGTEINVKIGLWTGEEYEYVDRGKFYINEEAKYNLDTNTYTTTAYDKMIKFNIKASENPLTFETGVVYTLREYLEMICNKCGVMYSFSFVGNMNSVAQVIDGDPYANNKDVTYRDILDDIAECLGTNFYINQNNRIANKDFNLTSQFTLDADILRDTNVYVGEKKEPIDGVQCYEGSTLINFAGQDNSVIRIRNNNILNAHSQVLINGVLSQIQGFYYYTYQLSTFGIFAFEPFDCFTTEYKENEYLLCSFHNDIRLTTGADEDISYEFNEDDCVSEYTLKNENISDAYIEIDKANAQIDINAEAIGEANSQVVLKATSNGNIVKAELSADPSTGSSFNVKADNINFNGKTFNLTTENIAMTSTNFSVDKNGNMTCNNANITGGNLQITSTEDNPKVNITSTNGNTTIYGSGYKIQRNNVNTVRFGVASSSTYGIYGRILLNGEANNNLDITTRNLRYYDANGTETVTLAGHDGYVYCYGVVQRSKEEYKKNFEKYENALSLIKNIDIYKYNFKSENDNDKKHIGFVIGKKYKYPKEVTINDEGVDVYAFASICCKAIQEQQEQIEKMQKEINSLKEMTDNGK